MIKKIVSVVAAAALCAPLAANAGAKATGSVSVYTSGTTVTLSGSMNNHYSTNAVSRISVWGVANGGVSFAATANDGTYFSCFMSPTDASINEARMLRTTMGNGAYISISRTTTSSYCTGLNIQTDSRYMD